MELNLSSKLLLDVDPIIMKQITDALSINTAWLEVVNTVGLYSSDEILKFQCSASPARCVLNDLAHKLCPIDGLCLILRNCKLYDALLIISGPEEMQVIQQPTANLKTNSIHIDKEHTLELKFEVKGLPIPHFTWMKDNVPVQPNQNDSVLKINNFSYKDEGEYWCVVNQTISNNKPVEINSDSVLVQMTPILCKIVEQPPSKYYHRTLDEPVILKCLASGHPAPSYQWYHNGAELANETNSELKIFSANILHNGDYFCEIKNSENRIRTQSTVLKVLPTRQYVNKKIALLIANQHYENISNLQSPINDVRTLAEALKSFHFETLTLMNLSFQNMIRFIEIFSEDINNESYVIFYYAGHGFEYGDRYIVPTDSPCAENYNSMNTVSEKLILQMVLEKKPKLLVTILDMCLRTPGSINTKNFIKNPPILYSPERNLIQVYTTSSQRSSYEGPNNGIYIKNLKKYLASDLPIHEILEATQRNMSMEHHIVVNKQIPYLGSTVTDDFFFNDVSTSDLTSRCQRLLPIVDRAEIIAFSNPDHEYTFRVHVTSYMNCYNNVLHIVVDNGPQVTHSGVKQRNQISQFHNKNTNIIVQNIQDLDTPLIIYLSYNGEIKSCIM